MLAQLLGAFAPGHVLEHGGKEYEFRRVDQRMKAALATAYLRRARQIVYDLRPDVSDEQFDRQLEAVTSAYRRGQYGFPMGESFGYYLGDGLPELVEQLAGCTREEAEELCQERSVEVLHLCLCVVMESFPDLKKKALKTPDSPELQALLTLISPTAGSDTGPPPSPATASTPTSSPA